MRSVSSGFGSNSPDVLASEESDEASPVSGGMVDPSAKQKATRESAFDQRRAVWW